MIRFSQYTKFDESVETQKERKIHYWDRKQQVLPFPKKQDYEKRHLQEYEKKEKLEQEDPQSLKFKEVVYPEVSEEIVQLKPLTEQETEKINKEIKEKEEENKKYQTGYSGSWYLQEKEKLEKILEANKTLDGRLKLKLLDSYKELRETSIKFYETYKEANILSISEPSQTIDVNLTYIDLIKKLPEYMAALITSYIGELFGSVKHSSYGRYSRYEEISNALSQNLLQGFNLFNLNVQNIQEIITKIITITALMEQIINEYNRKKKLITLLEKKTKKVSDEFLSNAEYIEFLNWMEKNYPQMKEEIINGIIKTFIEYKHQTTIDNVKEMKTYKSIYDKAILLSVRKPYTHITDYVTEKLTKEIDEQVTKIFTYKVNSLSSLIEETLNTADLKYEELRDTFGMSYSRLENINTPLSSINFDKILKYIKVNYNLDLSTTFQFIEKSIQQSTLLKNKDDFTTPEEEQNLLKRSQNLYSNYIFYFLYSLLKTIRSRSQRAESAITGIVYDYFSKYVQQNTNIPKIDKEFIKYVSKLTIKDFEQISNKIIRNLLVDSMPNFSSYHSLQNIPNFSLLNNFLKNTDVQSFSISSIIKLLTDNLPDLPKEFALQFARDIFKTGNMIVLEQVGHINERAYIFKFMIEILKKHNKFYSNNFINLVNKYIGTINNSFADISSDINMTGNEIVNIAVQSIRNIDTIETDLKSLTEAVHFIHNNARNIGADKIISIISNPNFHQLSKTKVIEKMIKAYISILNEGGLTKILKTNSKVITELKKRNYINNKFVDNIKYIVSYFDSNVVLKPNSDDFTKMFSVTSQYETDFATIQNFGALIELLKDYKPKDKNLFKLNMDIGNNLRFRVLKDKDPRALRVGVETNCCQRIGGVGESAAKDSFINPLAGVLVLEWKSPDDQWLLLSQSYFHYVPDDNGFILDNVESNKKNVEDSNIDLEQIYAYYASKVGKKLKMKYFVAGKGYSKLDDDEFETHRMNKDLRSFDPRAISGRSSHYSDFNETNSINLLRSKYDMKNLVEKFEGKKEDKKAGLLQQLRKLALQSIYVERHLNHA